MPCVAPVGMDCSLISLVPGSTFHITQCTHVPRDASGSSTINARDFVLGGMLSIMRGGFTSIPSHVYFGGMCSLCLKAGLVIFTAPISVVSASKEFKSNEQIKTPCPGNTASHHTTSVKNDSS